MRKSFIFYKSFYDSIKELDPLDQAQIYNAIFQYEFDDKEIELNGICKSIFALIIPLLKANDKRYENGCKGGRPKSNKNDEKIGLKITKQKPKNNQNETKPEPNVLCIMNNELCNMNYELLKYTRKKTSFEKFWNAYPKKVSKQKCIKWFEQNKPNEQTLDFMLKQLERFKQTKEWQQNNGQFIPYPDTWLRNKRWEDEFKTENEKEEEMIKRLEAKYENDNTRD